MSRRRNRKREAKSLAEIISRSMCALLRHNLVDKGFKMRPDGTIAVDALLAHEPLVARGLTPSLLDEIVSIDAKGRFSILTDPDGQRWIRANQGPKNKPMVTLIIILGVILLILGFVVFILTLCTAKKQGNCSRHHHTRATSGLALKGLQILVKLPSYKIYKCKFI